MRSRERAKLASGVMSSEARHLRTRYASLVWRFLASLGMTLALLPFCGRVIAEDNWSLTTADFNTQTINVLSINETSINTGPADGAGTAISLEKLLVLQHAQTSPLPQSKLTFFLSHDNRITGDVIEMKGEDLRVKSAPLGEVTVPLKQIVAIIKSGSQLGVLAENRTEDVVTLGNGDVVAGIIAEISQATVSVQRSGGETTAVPMETVSRIVLASTAGSSQSSERSYRVSLSDGTSVTTPLVQLDGTRVQTRAFGDKQSIPTAAVKTIEQINGPVVWASSLPIEDEVQTPYYGDRAHKSQRDTSVLGQPIRSGTQMFARGIGVHSYSSLTYVIDPSFHVFRTQYAIDGELPWADVTVRIKVDDKVVHEQAGVRAGKLPSVVSVDVNGAKKLTLEVDYGENYDVQDRLNWIEPAFLR